MNAALLLILPFFSASTNLLSGLEQSLDAGFQEETYRRYLYYCRQQNEGSRLTEHSQEWLEVYPDREILRIGEAEGLLMSTRTQEGIKKFRDLYEESYVWANEIIFILNELEPGEVSWFVEQERKRTGNRTLHARLMAEAYLKESNERKALQEIAEALATGQSPHIFKKELNELSQTLGAEQVLNKLRYASSRTGFQLALELADTRNMEKAINETNDERVLIMMGQLAEHNDYPEQALLAYRKAARKEDAARVLTQLGRTEEALTILGGNISRQGLQQKALLQATSSKTYQDAIKTYKELQTRYGSRPEWSFGIAVLYLLEGNDKKAYEYLHGIAPDSSILLLKGILAILDDELDSVKYFLDQSMISFPGNSYENDFLLLYNIALTAAEVGKQYAEALAAFYWGDKEDAYEKSIKLVETNTELEDEALLLAAESLVGLKRWNQAEALYKDLAENYPKSPLSARGAFEQALLLRDHLNGAEQARELLKDLIIRNPTSLYADLARQEL
ncbi:tetratricopeptide repeat protein [candidate division WOR-3 bacterium]|nr:tetratricopeptide repeat protein [candidate division WOR-3 bacterium]